MPISKYWLGIVERTKTRIIVVYAVTIGNNIQDELVYKLNELNLMLQNLLKNIICQSVNIDFILYLSVLYLCGKNFGINNKKQNNKKQ